MKVLTTITLRGSQKRLRADSIRSPAACRGVQVRGRPFLSEHTDDTRLRYYKGGQSEACPLFRMPIELVGTAQVRLCLDVHLRRETGVQTMQPRPPPYGSSSVSQ
jgi:hypothetical protein